MNGEKTIVIDEYTSEKLDEIRLAIAELDRLGVYRIVAFEGFDLKNDEHLIHALIGSTARTMQVMLEDARAGR